MRARFTTQNLYQTPVLLDWQINWIAENDSPSVFITNPDNNAHIRDLVSVEATATDSTGITKIEYYIDNNLKHTDYDFPYAYSWDTTSETEGSHAIKVLAYDAANNLPGSDEIIVIVDNSTPPTITATTPTNNTTNISVDTTISIVFSEAVDTATINNTTESSGYHRYHSCGCLH